MTQQSDLGRFPFSQTRAQREIEQLFLTLIKLDIKWGQSWTRDKWNCPLKRKGQLWCSTGLVQPDQFGCTVWCWCGCICLVVLFLVWPHQFRVSYTGPVVLIQLRSGWCNTNELSIKYFWQPPAEQSAQRRQQHKPSDILELGNVNLLSLPGTHQSICTDC